MVLIKNLKFFHLFIFGKLRKSENMFDNILERKKKLFRKENVFEDILGRKKSFFRL